MFCDFLLAFRIIFCFILLVVNYVFVLQAYSSPACDVSLKVRYKKDGDSDFSSSFSNIGSGETKEISWTLPYRTRYFVSVTPYDDTFPIEDRKRTKSILTACR